MCKSRATKSALPLDKDTKINRSLHVFILSYTLYKCDIPCIGILANTFHYTPDVCAEKNFFILRLLFFCCSFPDTISSTFAWIDCRAADRRLSEYVDNCCTGEMSSDELFSHAKGDSKPPTSVDVVREGAASTIAAVAAAAAESEYMDFPMNEPLIAVDDLRDSSNRATAALRVVSDETDVRLASGFSMNEEHGIAASTLFDSWSSTP